MPPDLLAEKRAKKAAYMREYLRNHPEQRKKSIERIKKARAADPSIRKREYANNREHHLAKEKERRKNFPEKIAAYERKRYANPERKADVIARADARRKAHPEIRKAEDARYRERHKEEITAYNREYFKTHPDVIRQSNHRRRAQKYTAPFEQFRSIEIYERDNWMCGICGQPVNKELKHPDPMSPSLDHVIPLSKGGHHMRTNAQCSHLCCNKKKNAFPFGLASAE